MHPSDLIPPPLEQGFASAFALCQACPSEVSPYTSARILLLQAMEKAVVTLSHRLMPSLSDQDTRRDIALIRRVDARQEAAAASLHAYGKSDMQQAVLFAMLSLELSAVLAQRLGEGETRRALHFALPEFLDELYRLSNLMMLLEERSARQLLAGYTEIMPGRPTIACHRHPYDEVRKPATPQDPLEEMAPLMLSAVIAEKRALYLSAAARAESPEARGLYLELSLIAEQHQTHFESLLPCRQPLEELLFSQYAEGYLYESCAQEEENAFLRQRWLQERDFEFAHIRKVTCMIQKETGKEPALPAFPDPLRLGPSKGYIRDILQGVGVTALREGYVPVGTLQKGADFFRYQQRVCGNPAQVPSHVVVDKLIEKTGEDYRFEIAPHPVEALRNRQTDNIQVGR